MNALIGATALSTAIPFAAAANENDDRELLDLCAEMTEVQRESKALSDAMSAAHKRAEMAVPVPHELLDTTIAASPDFTEEMKRQFEQFPPHEGFAIARHQLETAIKQCWPYSGVNISSEDEGRIIIRTTPPIQTEEEKAVCRAREMRLRSLLPKLDDYSSRWRAALKREGYEEDGERETALNAEQEEIESAIVEIEATTPAGVLAKLAIWNSDPDRFNEYGAGEISLAESIMRDLPAVLGAAHSAMS